MIMEKEYIFWEGRGIDDPRSPHKIIVKESELTKSQKELLIGDIIHKFNNLPEDLKMEFLHKVLKEWTSMYEDRMLEELGFGSDRPSLEDLMDSEDFLNMPGDED